MAVLSRRAVEDGMVDGQRASERGDGVLLCDASD